MDSKIINWGKYKIYYPSTPSWVFLVMIQKPLWCANIVKFNFIIVNNFFQKKSNFFKKNKKHKPSL